MNVLGVLILLIPFFLFQVSQMAKAKKWDDVRLLSFDLQTVEFTYMTVGFSFTLW